MFDPAGAHMILAQFAFAGGHAASAAAPVAASAAPAAPAIIATPIPASAAPSVAWAAVVNAFLPAIQTVTGMIIAGVITWAIRKYFPPQLANAILTSKNQQQLETITGAAINYGFAAVENAEKGKTLEVPTANKVIGKAIEYFNAHAPELAADLGDRLSSIIVSRLSAQGAISSEAKVDPAKATTAAPLTADKSQVEAPAVTAKGQG